jgi:hypothetical protein
MIQMRRITPPAEQPVEQHRDRQDRHHVEQYRHQQVVIAKCVHRIATDHRRQRGGPARRMDAARERHRTHRQAHRQRRGERKAR